MAARTSHFRSRRIAPKQSGVALTITPAKAGWDLVAFNVRTVAKGATWSAKLKKEECCLVLMSGECEATWHSAEGQQGRARLGPRTSVFGSYPHALYLPANTRVAVKATAATELADCRAPSSSALPPQVVRPDQCGYEIRGGRMSIIWRVALPPPRIS